MHPERPILGRREPLLAWAGSLVQTCGAQTAPERPNRTQANARPGTPPAPPLATPSQTLPRPTAKEQTERTPTDPHKTPNAPTSDPPTPPPPSHPTPAPHPSSPTRTQRRRPWSARFVSRAAQEALEERPAPRRLRARPWPWRGPVRELRLLRLRPHRARTGPVSSSERRRSVKTGAHPRNAGGVVGGCPRCGTSRAEQPRRVRGRCPSAGERGRLAGRRGARRRRRRRRR